MTLAAGTRHGQYEVPSQLGAGAMGELYRAKDTKLRCFVELKFLLPEMTRDATAVERFERGAQAASARIRSYAGLQKPS